MTYEYSKRADGLVITGCGGGGEILYIPEQIGGEPVTAIGSAALRDNKVIKKLGLPDGVREIEDGAFSNSALDAVRLPKGLERIGAQAFLGCGRLVRIRVPERTKKIGNAAFYGCAGLERVIFPASLVEIGYNVFSGCPALASIKCPRGSYAMDWAERNGYGGNLVYDYEICVGGINLKKYIGGEAVHKMPPYVNGKRVAALDEEAFAGCGYVESVELLRGLTVVEKFTFRDCAGLKRVVLPETVREIKTHAFVGCVSLKEVNFPPSLEYVGTHAFRDCASLEKISLPAKIAGINSKTFAGCESLAEAGLPEGITFIADDAFAGCGNLKTVRCAEGSYAALWAGERGYAVSAELPCNGFA
ncbi:MAG: leucine-rich repeat domain-containing protein [Oscillospiraceae bacterium]|jgi:hypothetical protein|nr:leucine-rich repeat domain-containing protein [Oscillospiraceae bacterium]